MKEMYSHVLVQSACHPPIASCLQTLRLAQWQVVQHVMKRPDTMTDEFRDMLSSQATADHNGRPETTTYGSVFICSPRQKETETDSEVFVIVSRGISLDRSGLTPAILHTLHTHTHTHTRTHTHTHTHTASTVELDTSGSHCYCSYIRRPSQS